MEKKIYRSKDDRVISGVCGGIAEYLDVDTTIIRLLWAVSIIFAGTGVLAYILCIFIIPEESNSKEKDDGNEEEIIPVNDEKKVEKKKRDSSNTIGLIFIVIGVLFMARKLLWWLNININVDLLWPVVFIIFGLYLIAKKKK